MKNIATKHLLATIAASLGLTIAGTCSAATVDWFLKLDKIEGESTDARHKGEIDVLAWSWGVAQAASSGNGANRAGKACISDLAFTKLIDKATPQLIGNAATGLRIANGVLIGRKAGGDGKATLVEFLKIELTNVLVSSFQSGASTGAVPTESISLSFTSMTVEYREQKADGSLGNAVTATISGGC